LVGIEEITVNCRRVLISRLVDVLKDSSIAKPRAFC
jgi:hypothetical protein